jgi:hypothetical protein
MSSVALFRKINLFPGDLLQPSLLQHASSALSVTAAYHQRQNLIWQIPQGQEFRNRNPRRDEMECRRVYND